MAPSAKVPVTPWEPSTKRLQGVTDWARFVDNRTVEPPEPLCQAAALEVAVKAWWRGAPGRKNTSFDKDSWIRLSAAGGVEGGAVELLQRSGIPEVVLQGGLQLSQFMLQDEETRKTWRDCQKDEANFVPKVIQQMFQRFQIRATVPFKGLDKPCLVLKPRPCSETPARQAEKNARTPATPPGAPLGQVMRRRPSLRSPSPEPLDFHVIEDRATAPPLLVYTLQEHFKDFYVTRKSSMSPSPDTTLRQPRSPLPAGEGAEPRSFSPQSMGSYSSRSVSPETRGSPGMPTKPTTPARPPPSCRSTGSKRPCVHPSTPYWKSESARPWRQPCQSPRSSSNPSNFDRWAVVKKQKARSEMERQKAREVPRMSESSARMPKILHDGKCYKKTSEQVVRDIGEIRRIFDYFDSDQSGTIEPNEWLPLLSRLMRLPKSEMNMSRVWSMWDAVDVDGSGTISFDEFQSWYCESFQIEHPDFTDFFSKDLLDENEIMIREVARNLGMDNVMIEKLWKEFIRIDTDCSGTVELDEFKVMLQNQMRKGTGSPSRGPGSPKKPNPEQAEVPNNIVMKFWNDLDPAGSGSVGFSDFAGWYFKFFQDESQSPMERYYQKLALGARRDFFGSV